MPDKWGFKERRTAEILSKVANERRGEVKYATEVERLEAGLPGSGSVIVHLDGQLLAASFNSETREVTLGEALGYVYRRVNENDEICSQTHDYTPEKKTLQPDRDEFGECNFKRIYNPTKVVYPACSFVECVVDNHGDLYVSGPAFETAITTTTGGISPVDPECAGRCKWVWDYDTQEWTKTEDQCSSTTTSTPDPNTTSSTTTTPACRCGDPSFSPTSTTQPPPNCGCAKPQFCGIDDEDCTWTSCVDQNMSQPDFPECSTSTSTTTTTEDPTSTSTSTSTSTTSTTCPCTSTSTSTTTPASCADGCDWWTAMGTFWVKTFDGCASICPCPRPDDGDLDICVTAHTPCIPVVTGTTTTSHFCIGHCDWFYGPVGNPDDNVFKWYLTGEHCDSDPGTLCRCPAPTEAGDECGTGRTYCVPPTTSSTTSSTTSTTPDPCCTSSTSSTTPNPCEKNVCVWRWDEMEMDWIEVKNECGDDCSCYPPSTNGAEDCELKETSCSTGTTTSTSSTTTTCDPFSFNPPGPFQAGICCFPPGGPGSCVEGILKYACEAADGTFLPYQCDFPPTISCADIGDDCTFVPSTTTSTSTTSTTIT